MYTHLEDALDILSFLHNHSLMTEPLRDVIESARESIQMYIEEGYRMKPEETSIGD